MGLLTNPLSKIIVLSVVLSVGFLSTILAGALYKNWLPLLSALFFASAQLPVSVFGQKSKDDFMSESSAYVADLGKFLSTFLTVSGFGISFVLYHSRLITLTAMILSIVGGVLINGTIVAFSSFFESAEDAELTGFEI